MKIKLTLEEKFYKFFGYGFMVNENSKQIHRLSDKKSNCHTDMIAHKRYVTKKTALKLLDGLYDGCRSCWKEKDNN